MTQLVGKGVGLLAAHLERLEKGIKTLIITIFIYIKKCKEKMSMLRRDIETIKKTRLSI